MAYELHGVIYTLGQFCNTISHACVLDMSANTVEMSLKLEQAESFNRQFSLIEVVSVS